MSYWISTGFVFLDKLVAVDLCQAALIVPDWQQPVYHHVATSCVQGSK